MTPWELVLQHYRFPSEINGRPFNPLPLQIQVINERAPDPNAGFWLDMATGKTFVATACVLYHRIMWGNTAVVIMPPLLVVQWVRWLSLVTDLKTGKPLTTTAYKGTPAQRAKLDLDADFVCAGVQIFKKDNRRFTEFFQNRPYSLIIDEATLAANVGSDNHDLLFTFSLAHPVLALTGTPANKPGDAYGLMKFSAPGTYRNKKQFENLHVAERDFFGNPAKWRDLDKLHQNLLINSSRVLYQDMYPASETPHFIPLEYDLEPTHHKLYCRLAEDEILKLPDGGKVDGTTAQRLRHALGQIIINYGHFSGDASDVSAGIEMIEETLSELGNGKLVVFADYRMTVRQIVTRFASVGAVAINSEVSETQKQKNLDKFKSDPGCRLIVIQFISGGKGLDGLQHVSNTCMFIEPCQQPRDFHQAYKRLDRPGQTQRVRVLLPIARGTLQVRAFHNLLYNDGVVNQVVRNVVDLRKEIFGE